MASLLHCYLVLVIWRFGGAFALSDSFLDSDDIITPLSTSSTSDGSLWNADVLSSCSPGGVELPSKLRARNPICLPDSEAPSTTQLQVPEIPDLAEIRNALTNKPLKTAPDRKSIKIMYLNGMTMGTDDPNYYCARYAEESYSVPVCGSGNEWDRVVETPPYYSKVENSILLGPARSAWKCLESEFFCCLIWVPYHSSSGTGQGSECVNLLEFGWQGYDTETANVPSLAQGDWMIQESQSFDDDLWSRWGKWPTTDDQLQQQQFEESLREFYPIPYRDPLDDPRFDPEDDPVPPFDPLD